jgi:hypothetical protein
MRERVRRSPNVAVIAIGAFLLAFAVRLAWVLRVQSPLDAEYSDMGGYVARAEGLLAHQVPSEPRELTLYPFGTHCLLALEFLVLGRHAARAIAVAHAFVGAIPAACAPLLTVRLLPRLWAAALVGGLVALWYPQVCFAGFFLSEIWFSAAIALHACLTACDWKRPSGRLGEGLVSAVAFVIRPQFLLTWAIEMAARTLSLVRRRGVRAAARVVLWPVLPMVVAIAASSVRLHQLSGHWGLIAESGLNRVWADTDICKVEARWHAPNGDEKDYEFSPPAKQPCTESGTVSIDGFIADPDILGSIRRERLRGVSLGHRLSRMFGNARLLIDKNLPWPESNYQDPPWRAALQEAFARVFEFVILPLSVLGLVLGPRNATMLILAANLATVTVAAAVFFGEARYHVPYDAFAIVLAVVGAHEVSRRGLSLVRRLRCHRASRLRGPPVVATNPTAPSSM